MTRVGFQVRGTVRPPFVPRWTKSGEAISTTNYSEQHCNLTPVVFLDQPGGGATRCIEEIAIYTKKSSDRDLVLLVSDLTKRCEWGILDFMLSLRNDAVSSISIADLTNLPDYNFRGFDYLAVLYWCVELNCEGSEPIFLNSPYLENYKKLKRPITAIATAGIAELLDLGGVIFDLATCAVEESIEKRISKNLKKLARYKLPLGGAHADHIRTRLTKGEHLTRLDITDALLKELEIGFQKTFLKNSKIRFMSISDAIDILESGKVTRSGRDFSRAFEKILMMIDGHENTISVAAGRDVYDSSVKELPGTFWKIHRLRGVTPEEIIPYIKDLTSSESLKKLCANLLTPDQNNVANLAMYAEVWDLIQRGDSIEFT